MDKLDILQQLKQEKIVAVVRADSIEHAVSYALAAYEGGIRFLEITMTIPGAIDVIKQLKAMNIKDMIIGVGTVLDEATASQSMNAGAQFVVLPHFDETIVRVCNRRRIPVMTGAMSIKEVMLGLEFGVDVIKLFPGGSFGPKIIKDYKGPLPQAHFMPTGGVALDNLKDWFGHGAYAVGIGGNLAKDAKNGDYSCVIKEARKYVDAIKGLN